MNKPEQKFKAGSVTATVWTNNTTKGTYSTIQLGRNYKDKDNKWNFTNSLKDSDIPKAVLVLNKAYEYLMIKDEQSL